MPSLNPTNMPISARDMLKMPSPNDLLGLQVKAELNKLEPAPTAYAKLLEMDNSQSMDIDDVGNETARLLIRDRFDKIEKARQAVPP